MKHTVIGNWGKMMDYKNAPQKQHIKGLANKRNIWIYNKSESWQRIWMTRRDIKLGEKH
jgi:hypothetical protein